MILPIYVYGQPVLRKVAEDITPDYPNLKELIENMFETMVHADGVGLAAPQIGLPIRVVTITLDPLSEDYPEFKGFNKAYFGSRRGRSEYGRGMLKPSRYSRNSEER